LYKNVKELLTAINGVLIRRESRCASRLISYLTEGKKPDIKNIPAKHRKHATKNISGKFDWIAS